MAYPSPIHCPNGFFPNNPYHNHELNQGVAPPGRTHLTYRRRAKQVEDKAKHKRSKRFCTCVYVLIS